MAKIQIICIYLIKNPSGRIYIGQTWDLTKRYKSGVSPSQRLLYRSYQKHGKENHTKQIIHQFHGDITQLDLDYWEKHYIDLYRLEGYKLLNIREGGGNNGALSVETKELLRQRKNEWIKLNPEKQKSITAAACAANIGKKRSDETKKLQSNAAKGKPKSEQHRLNASAAKKGKPSPHKGNHFSTEAANRIRAAAKTRKQKKCPVNQFDLNHNLIKEWPSIQEAALHLGIHKGVISGCIRGLKSYNTAGGFKWEYANDADNIAYKNRVRKPNSNSKPIIQESLIGAFVKEWNSATEAALKTNIQKVDIMKCCQSKRKSAGGYIWKYK